MNKYYQPKISIITVCLNCFSEIETTIKSIINQTYSNIEYIIIDGGSNDGTVDIIKEYSQYNILWISEPDNGIYNAMNKGILKATGKWLNFMNAGDTFTSNNVIAEISEFLNSESYKIIYGNIIRCFPRLKERVTGITKNDPDIIDFFQNTINHQGAFIDAGLFKKYGLYDETYKLASDWEFFIKVVGISHEKVKYINIDIAFFQMDGASTKKPQKYIEESDEIKMSLFKNYYPYLQELSEYRKSSIIHTLLNIRLFIKSKKIGKKIKHYILIMRNISGTK